MKYLMTFENQTEYHNYLNSDDIWLPRVSRIINAGENHTNENKYDDNGPTRIEYSNIGDEFIQIANDGIMFMNDKIYNIGADPVKFSAEIEGETIIIKTTNLETGQLTNDAYIDEETESIVINYPTRTQTYSLSNLI